MSIKVSLAIFFISLFLGNIALAGLGSPPKKKEIDFKEGMVRLPSYHRLNVPAGFKAAINDDAFIALENLEVYLSDYAEPVAVIVPIDSSFGDNSPYLVVVKYPRAEVRYKDLKEVNNLKLYNLISDNWLNNEVMDWIFVKLDTSIINSNPTRHLTLKSIYECSVDGKGLSNYHLSHWIFGDLFSYHYVFVCPVNSADKYLRNLDWFNNLLSVEETWYLTPMHDESWAEEKIELGEFLCLDHFGTYKYGTISLKALRTRDSLALIEKNKTKKNLPTSKGINWVLLVRVGFFIISLLFLAKGFGWIKFKR